MIEKAIIIIRAIARMTLFIVLLACLAGIGMTISGLSAFALKYAGATDIVAFVISIVAGIAATVAAAYCMVRYIKI